MAVIFSRRVWFCGYGYCIAKNVLAICIKFRFVSKVLFHLKQLHLIGRLEGRIQNQKIRQRNDRVEKKEMTRSLLAYSNMPLQKASKKFEEH